MNAIKPSPNKEHWPRCSSPNVECRKRDLVVRITDWTRQKTSEPAYDVEVYIGGVYDFNESRVFSLFNMTREQAKQAAVQFASEQIAKLL